MMFVSLRMPLRILMALLTLIPVFAWADGIPTASGREQNQIIAFLGRAEFQAENDQQRREVVRALMDVLTKPTAELRANRYSNYEGQAEVWSLTELLQHYFVPNPPAALDEKTFYSNLRSSKVRSVIKKQLAIVRKSIE